MKRLSLLLLFLIMSVGMASAQSTVGKVVTGTVISSEDGKPIAGATVRSKKVKSKGTVTNLKGAFRLIVPDDETTLVVTFIGMQSQEVKVGKDIKVTLHPESTSLNELVVTAMGVSRSQKSLGYASASIKGADLSQSQAVNPMAALQGKISGVDISTAPGPGATQNVIIRGASSFGSNQPLYIIDGVPITNDQTRSGDNLNNSVDFGSGINALNPDDIAEMTVLKGAAATALYGSRAANGVVMITTKSGKNTDGRFRIQYDGSLTFSSVARLPEEQKLFGQGWNGNRALDENGNWGAMYDGKQRVWGHIVGADQRIRPYKYYENHLRDYYTIGRNYKNAVSLSGGNSKTNYFVSLSQNSLDGVIPSNKDTYERYTVSTRGSHQAKKLRVETSVNVSYENTKAVPAGQGTSMIRSLMEIANDIYIPWLSDYNNKFNNLDNYFTPYGVNPYFVLDNNTAEQRKVKVFGKFELSYDLLKNLKAVYRFGGDVENGQTQSHTAKRQPSKHSYNDGSSTITQGDYSQFRYQRVQLNHDLMLQYNGHLTEDLSLSGIVGLNANERYVDELKGYIDGIDIPGFYNLVNSTSPAKSKEYQSKRRLFGVYGSADLGYKDYLYLTLTARNDWSSTLPTHHNSYFYPGATLSFLVTDFMKKHYIGTGVLSFAKVRMAYGMTGNDTDVYNIYNRYVQSSLVNPKFPSIDNTSFPLNGVNAYTVSDKLGNDQLKPEQTHEFEFGFETKFFNHRLGIDFSYYNRFTENLIEILRKDPSSGFTQQAANLGDVRNKGIELSVSLTPIRTQDFTWDVVWNYSKNKNNVERLDAKEIYLTGFNGAGIYAVEGKPLGQFKMPVAVTAMVDGKEKFVVDGNGYIQPTASPVFIGKDVNDKYRMGLTNSMTYKGVKLYATLDFRYGGYMYSNTRQYLQWNGSGINTVANGRRPFILPNSVIQNPDGTYSENTRVVDPTQLHTFYSDKGGLIGPTSPIISRSYLKLREVGLSYSIPKSWCSLFRIRSARLNCTMTNFLLWTPNDNVFVDPEATTFGNDINAKFGEFNANPTNHDFTFALSLGI